ncbi:MAG: proton-conducting transporter membrane subunit [Pseudomonadota bacterium]|nr:proton-conducting transporter membrane subunit [Pseudomonadota bacterium]
MPFELIALVPLLPFLAALLIALLHLAGPARGEAGERLTARITLLASSLSFLTLLGLDAAALQAGLPGQVHVADWFASGALKLPLSFTLDALSLGFATLVAFIALVTLKFSVNYMHREAGFHRFFIGMNLFAAGMALIVLAGNAALAFVGWELAGLSSWMLIGYAYERDTATANAQRAFLTNRVGDAGFLLGIALAFLWLGSLDWADMSVGAERLPTLYVGLMALGFVTAALAKSAQVPFSPWIARALEGPTPSSAIFYGAVMVHAGVYLLIRLQPILVHAPGVMALIALLGLLTALYGWIVGYVQTDVKSGLLFATLTQVGLMFLACGLGLFEVAAWHMALHATWRAWQFLAAPSYMHLLHQAAPAAPAWLTRFPRLYTAALQRFWLETLADRLLTRPTQALARDMRAINDNVVSRLVGMPEAQRAAALLDVRENNEAVVKGRGLAGGLLMWVAEHLGQFEQRLVLQGGGGSLGAGLRRLGDWLQWVESLLEQPRYLLLMVMATLVVIL